MTNNFRRDKAPLLPTQTNGSAGQSSHRLNQHKISFPSSSTSALGAPDSPCGESSTDGSRTLIGSDAGGGGDSSAKGRSRRYRDDPEAGDGFGGGDQRVALLPEQKREGVPKLSRECLWSEIKCYGSYILPVLLVFGVLVIGASLAAVGWKKGWFEHS